MVFKIFDAYGSKKWYEKSKILKEYCGTWDEICNPETEYSEKSMNKNVHIK